MQWMLTRLKSHIETPDGYLEESAWRYPHSQVTEGILNDSKAPKLLLSLTGLDLDIFCAWQIADHIND